MEQNPYVRKDGEKIEITDEGYRYLDSIVTDTKGPVYAFTGATDPVMVAAAMARLSRRGDDLREIYLDEFANVPIEKAENLIKRVVTAYGDDSVQQLICIQFVVENASNLLTKRLEWGRFAGYLEQSTRYIYFDKKDKFSHYKYYAPPNLPPEIKKTYISHLNKIFDQYSYIVRELTDFIRLNSKEPTDKLERQAWLGATRAQACDAARPALPVATKSTVGVVAVAQSVESLILRLASEDLIESQETAKYILRESRKIIPAFLERADMPERGGAMINYRKDIKTAMKALVERYLPRINENGEETILLDYWPKNELSLVPEMLFESSGLPLKIIKSNVKKWPRAKQLEVFSAYIGNRFNRRHKPGRALEKAHYEWQITADYGTFRDLQRHRVVDMMEWQRLTAAYGYEVPKLVADAGMENMFRNCFELSEDLYKLLANSGFAEEAQYATLLGHRMRYRFMINARESFHIHELRTGPQGHPGYRKIVNEMHKKLCEAHPLIGAAMKFVNKGEDPELTRMAAELATQRKLALLEKNETSRE